MEYGNVNFKIRYNVNSHNAVSIATRYVLDGLGIASRWVRGFPHTSRPALKPIQPPIQWVTRVFIGFKVARA
jgi:hypothetical protein